MAHATVIHRAGARPAELILAARDIVGGAPQRVPWRGRTLLLWRDPTGAVAAELHVCTHGPDLQSEIPDEPCLLCMEAASTVLDVAEIDGRVHIAMPA